MPALPEDIGAASRAVAVATWASPAVAARYPSARDGSITPADGYFDAIADAQTVVVARAVLLGTERRRFAAEVHDLLWPTIEAGVPQLRLIDAEQGVDGGFLAARVELDLEAETSTLELYG